MKVPKRLKIYQGVLHCHEGSTGGAIEYLKAQQEKLDWPDGTDICLIRRDALQKMYDEIEHLRYLVFS